MAAPSNGDGFGDDDDFEDFGGFEAADTMNLPQQAVPNAQAIPNVWAAMVAPAVHGVSSVRPDLLCGQNRFPQHLDNPLTLDVAGSAQASVPRDDNIPTEGAIGDAGHPGEMDFANFPDTDDIDLDNINLANDILDGSFRSSNNQSGTSAQSHGMEQLPDISGLDLAAGISNQVSGVNANIEFVPNNTPPVSAQNGPTENISNIALDLNFDRNNQVTNQQQADRVVSNEIANNEPANERRDQSVEENSLLQQANEEKERVQKELEKRLEENGRLSEDLARTQQLAESLQQRYNELQETHKKQLEELREAGHETLTVVVEEYKALLMTSLQQQQEMNETSLCERLKIQSETFTDQLKSQQEEYKSLMEEQRKSSEEMFQKTLEGIKAKQNEEFNVLLSEERQKYAEYAQKEIEKEKEVLTNEIQAVIKSEQEKAKQAVESEQVIYQEKIDQAIVKHNNETEAALKEQKDKYEEELHKVVKEERVTARECVQQSVQTVRDDMNRYLHEQREADRTIQRRHLTSLDLFLGSARNQLSILLDSSNTDNKPSEVNTQHDNKDT